MKIKDMYTDAKTDSWRDVKSFLKRRVEQRPDDVDAAVDLLYFLIDLALEGPVRAQIDFVNESPEIGREVDALFHSTRSRFDRNPEYLFFFGYFMRLTNWFYGDGMYETADNMCRNAFTLEPTNILYEWAANRPADKLRRLALADSHVTSWLKSKGDYGEYLLGVLKTEMV